MVIGTVPSMVYPVYGRRAYSVDRLLIDLRASVPVSYCPL